MENRDNFIEDNLGLVHSCCKRFVGKGIEYDDLYQAGCVGLIKATDGFDESRGLCFSTYAVPVVLGEIRRLFRDGGSVKVSRSLRELASKIRYEQDKAGAIEQRELTVGELAERLCVSAEEIAESLCATQPTVSLTYANEDEEGQLDIAVGDNGDMLTDRLMLTELLNRLPENDRKLISLRYFDFKTQNETAAELSMTQVQVSRAEKKILCKLRSSLCE
jgi:RNA polymerase sporulation-specific sigma factor